MALKTQPQKSIRLRLPHLRVWQRQRTIWPRSSQRWSFSRWATATEVDPFLAERGSKDRKWQKVTNELHGQGLCESSGKDTIKHKVNTLIKYHENPKLCSHIARALAFHPSIAATMPAKLDNLTHTADRAHQVAEGKKDSVCKVEDKKKADSAFIHQMATRTLRPRQCTAVSSDVHMAVSRDSEKENTEPEETRPASRKRKECAESQEKLYQFELFVQSCITAPQNV
ncbi:hypothetical protein OH76DRAFT_1421572 [Lentinus brumalis]|uniref:Uncharacterized protein n=1 Tax=Lentinus brumalis TaxID=2498619 RepID=A0A371CUV0_9APHY|nr:hypothetical protein OH76DRAFT_1421572 [Polyporus brumalis]